MPRCTRLVIAPHSGHGAGTNFTIGRPLSCVILIVRSHYHLRVSYPKYLYTFIEAPGRNSSHINLLLSAVVAEPVLIVSHLTTLFAVETRRRWHEHYTSTSIVINSLGISSMGVPLFRGSSGSRNSGSICSFLSVT